MQYERSCMFCSIQTFLVQQILFCRCKKTCLVKTPTWRQNPFHWSWFILQFLSIILQHVLLIVPCIPRNVVLSGRSVFSLKISIHLCLCLSTLPPDGSTVTSNFTHCGFHVLNWPTVAFQCHQSSLAAWRWVSLEAAEPPGRRWWPQSRWWSEEEESTRPPAAGWAEPQILPDDSWSSCSPRHFVWWDKWNIITSQSQSFTLLSVPWSSKYLFNVAA